MRKLTCTEITGWQCDFEAEGDLNTQVKSKLRAHIAQAHGAEMGELDEAEKDAKTKELEKKMSSKLPFI